MKIIVISGTPGTGKTTIANFISTKINSIAISLSESVVREKLYNNYDDERKTFILNQKKVINYVRKIIKESSTPIQIDYLIFESHFTDIIPETFIDLAIILRCHPDELKRRLSVKEYSDSKIKENVQAEILGDSIHHFIEKQMKKPLIEIDTTHISIENVAELIINVIKGQFDFSRFKPGKIDWLEELNNKNKLKQFFDL